MAPAIAAIVSQSPPTDAPSRHASHGSSPATASTANAAGTDSCVARLVPTSGRSVSSGRGGSEAGHERVAHRSAPRRRPPATHRPRAAARRGRVHGERGRPRRTAAPSRPALTAAATAAAPAIATPVPCVAERGLHDAIDEQAPRSAHGDARPARSASRRRSWCRPARPRRDRRPAASAATARRVDGPSRSSEPRARIDVLPRREPSVPAPGGRFGRPTRPAGGPSSTACSVSSVTLPAGIPAAIGWSARPRAEAVDQRPKRGHDLRARQRLGRHPERVPDREPVQRAASAVAGAHSEASAGRRPRRAGRRAPWRRAPRGGSPR